MKEEPMDNQLDRCEFLLDFISHEIRNPLNSIIMFSDMLAEGNYGSLNPEQQEVLKRVLTSAYRIEHMTGDFLNLMRIESGKSFLHPEWIRLRKDIIEVTLNDLSEKFPHLADRLALIDQGDCSAGKIFADRQLLITLYDNLFFNAVKYGRKGGRIRWDCMMEGDSWLMRVFNEGEGVRKEDLETIFDKFVRIKDGSIPAQPGTGLGLYNVKRIVQLHKGKIWAESEYGRHFSIWFSIPKPSEKE